MITWNITYGEAYAQSLASGEIGNARQHAQTITRHYMNCVRQGLIPGVPPTLPAPALLGAPAPVGPSIPFLTFGARQQAFENTLYTYLQGKALVQGKANIQDLVQDSRRLVNKAKALKKRIKTLIEEGKTIEAEIAQLPQLIKELPKGLQELWDYETKKVEDLKRSTIDSINRLKNTNGGDVLYTLLTKTFAAEIGLINDTLSLKTAKLNQDTLVKIKDIVIRLRRLFGSGSSSGQYAGFKVYIQRKIKSAIENLLLIVESIFNPALIYSYMVDVARVKTTVRKYVLLLDQYVARSGKLKVAKARIEAEIKRDKIELQDFVQARLKDLQDLIKKRIEEHANNQKKYKQSTNTKALIKEIREDAKKIKEFIKTAKSELQKLKLIDSEFTNITNEIAKITNTVKAEYTTIATTVKKLSSLNTTTNLTKQEAIKSIAADREKIKNFTELKPNELQSLVNELAGSASALMSVFVVLVDMPTNLKDRLKVELNSIDGRYSVVVKSAKKLLVECNTLIALIENINAEPAVINGIKDNQDAEIKKISSEPDSDYTMVQVLRLLDKLEVRIKTFKKKIKAKLKEKSEKIKAKLEKKKENSKFIRELLNINAKLREQYNKKIKDQSETAEKKSLVQKGKTVAQKAKYLTTITTSATKIGNNTIQNKIFISDNDTELKKIIQNYYGYLGVDKKRSIQELNKERDQIIAEIDKQKQREIFAKLLYNLFTEIKSGQFINELEQQVANIGNTNNEAKQNLKNVIKFFKKTDIKSMSDVNNLIQQSATVLASMNAIISILMSVESKYINKTKQLINAYEQSFGKRTDKKTEQPDSIINTFFKDVKKSNSLIITLIQYTIKYVVKPLKKFIKEEIKKIKAEVAKAIKEESNKNKKRLDEFLSKQKDKLINLDAIGLTIAINIATRLFWTGATWQNPAGTTFVVTTIGSFKRLKALPVNGAQGISKEMSENFRQQLINASGQIIPNPATGIPPIPFRGYI